MSELPNPLVSAEIDRLGYAGFMLDVDRLLASELVALATPEECWAALMLWCRAWKQSPPASLPDDDRVLSAFSGAGKRWGKVKAMALRGFVKCSDGRLYHPVLADEARRAIKKRRQYESDQDRLKRWRNGKRNGIGSDDETRFNGVSEPEDRTGQDRTKNTPCGVLSEQGNGHDRKSRGTRLPDDWQLSEGDRTFAEQLGLIVADTLAEFRDHWRGAAGSRGVKLDWPATWRNWCRKAAQWRKPAVQRAGPATGIIEGFADALQARAGK